MTPSRPHVRWKLVADTLFSQPVGQETKARTIADMMVSTWSMEQCADGEMLNLSYLPGAVLVGHVLQEHEYLLGNRQGRQRLVVVILQAILPQTRFLGL